MRLRTTFGNMASGGLRCDVLTTFEKGWCGGKRLMLLHPPPFAILFVVRWRNFLLNRSDCVSYRGIGRMGMPLRMSRDFLGKGTEIITLRRKSLLNDLSSPKNTFTKLSGSPFGQCASKPGRHFFYRYTGDMPPNIAIPFFKKPIRAVTSPINTLLKIRLWVECACVQRWQYET